MSDWDESARIAAAKADPSAFGAIYDRYVDRIYSYIYHRVGNAHDAEDITSRTFYRALSHLAGYQDKGLPFTAWLYRIAHNLVANFHRDRQRRPVIALDDLVIRNTTDPHPEAAAELADQTGLLREVIRGLDPKRQELLTLKFSEGLSNAEVGMIMGRTEGAIKSLYHRTLLQLRKEMSKRGLDLERVDL